MVAHPGTNVFLFGSPNLANGTSNDTPYGAVLTTQEAWNIDKKIDDGTPTQGKVISILKKGATSAWATDVRDCSNNADPNIAQYDLLREEKSCSLKFIWDR